MKMGPMHLWLVTEPILHSALHSTPWLLMAGFTSGYWQSAPLLGPSWLLVSIISLNPRPDPVITAMTLASALWASSKSSCHQSRSFSGLTFPVCPWARSCLSWTLGELPWSGLALCFPSGPWAIVPGQWGASQKHHLLGLFFLLRLDWAHLLKISWEWKKPLVY